jgi:virulence-associated protein VagC
MDNNIARVVETAEGQSVHLPAGFHIDTRIVAVRRDGDAVILEQIKPATWPEGFFEKIRIDDPAFERPDQGKMPPAPALKGPNVGVA